MINFDTTYVLVYISYLSGESVEPLILEVLHGDKLHDVPRRLFAVGIFNPHIITVQLLHQVEVRVAHPHAAEIKDRGNRSDEINEGCSNGGAPLASKP